MINFLKKKKNLRLLHFVAPLAGKVIKLESVSDPVFAEKMMGDGYAVEPTESTIVAPLAGEIVMKKGHALGIRTDNGLEILLHLGIDTVTLKNDPFDLTVNEGDFVEAGQVVGMADWSKVDAAGVPKTTMVLFTNTAEKLQDMAINYQLVSAGQEIGQVTLK
ncbi:glucose PTS transporter subunit IIA [Lactococcus garvieae]|nr:glucose PTS transporter subunit IIA [Lactococcus garvieae]